MKEKLVSFFLSKINVAKFSETIRRSRFLSLPYKIIAQQMIDYEFPEHLFLESTNACNLKCKMCPRELRSIEVGFMDFNLFKKIVDEAAKRGPRNFSLHLFGEPLLSPDIVRMIGYIKEKNKKNSILLTTNGIFLSKDMAEKIIANGTDKVVISIHRADKEKYRETTGADQLEKVEANIMELIGIKEKNRKSKTKIYLRMVILKEEAEEIENLREKWASQPVIVEVREPHNYGGKIAGKNLNIERHPCYHLWFSPGINWDGKVSICCQDPFKEEIIGDVNSQTISEIWNSEKLKRYREYHLKGEYGKIPLCAKCNGWNIYPDIFFNWQKNKK